MDYLSLDGSYVTVTILLILVALKSNLMLCVQNFPRHRHQLLLELVRVRRAGIDAHTAVRRLAASMAASAALT